MLEAVPILQSDHSKLTLGLRKKVAERIKDQPWKLAGDSWKHEVEKAVKGESIGDVGTWGLNTANSRNVNELFELVFGDKLLDKCSWKGLSAASNRAYIDQMVKRRGAIVHRGRLDPGDGPLRLGLVRAWADWLGSVATKVDELAGQALLDLTGSSAW